jgi:nitroreductase
VAIEREAAMEFKEMVLRNRSYRRFEAGHRVALPELEALVALARCTPSAANRQPLKYVLSCEQACNARIFETLKWAAALPEWPGPEPTERPSAYIVVLLDTTISKTADVDVGIAAQTILLGAVEHDLGGCMFLNIRREALVQSLGLPAHLAVALVIALGKPVERIVLEDRPADGPLTYYRDPDRTHHVPKRTLAELIHARYG